MLSWVNRLGASAGILPALFGSVGLVIHVARSDYWRDWFDNASEKDLRTLAGVIAENSSAGDWVISDRPMLLYWANRPTPPNLTLLIRKRIASGSLTDEDLVQAVADYYPRVVALCSSRLAAFGRFQTELKKSYREILRRQIYRERTGEADRVCRILKRTAS